MNFHKFIVIFIYIFSLSVQFLDAKSIDFTKNASAILFESEVYVDKMNLSYLDIKKQIFKENNQSHINLGFQRDTNLWLRMTFYNDSDLKVEKILQIRNPLLEEIVLYDANTSIEKGTLNLIEAKDEIHTTFVISLNPQELRTYYLKAGNTTTALRLGIYLKDKITLLKEDYKEEMTIYLFLMILFLLLFYNLFLFIYTKEKVYVYYVLYLTALVFQQSTYLGVTQMYMPVWFTYYDNLSVVPKVNFMYITAILFAKSFLETKRYVKIDKIYNLILLFAIIEIPLFGSKYFYVPEIAIITALIFIYFNMYASIYIYRQGLKQARLFVLGWGLQLVGFSLMILDGLGLISTMSELPSLILILTALESLILALAFTDRYIVFKSEKEKADAVLLSELTNRQSVIEREIKHATYKLHKSLENEKNLLKELNHRTKNNLQLILSLVRIQSDTASGEVKNQFTDLIGRISTIAKTHTMLSLEENIKNINMLEYIEELCNDLESLSIKNIIFRLKVHNLEMPIQLAGYVGLIINELVTNSIKYVLNKEIIIELELYHEKGEYILLLTDNAKEVNLEVPKSSGLGLKLVHTLVENQLEGSLERKKGKRFSYMIRFKE